MKTSELKIGNVYIYPFKGSYFILLLREITSEDLIFATYNSENNKWYIPDVWNYDFENDGFEKLKSKKLSKVELRDCIQALFTNVE